MPTLTAMAEGIGILKARGETVAVAECSARPERTTSWRPRAGPQRMEREHELIGFLPRTAPGAAAGDHDTGLEQAAGVALGMRGWRFVAGAGFGSDMRAGA